MQASPNLRESRWTPPAIFTFPVRGRVFGNLLRIPGSSKPSQVNLLQASEVMAVRPSMPFSGTPFRR